jgi:hypothetical protein
MIIAVLPNLDKRGSSQVVERLGTLLKKEGIESKKNVCHILSLSHENAEFVYGKFLYPENLSRFGRSDKYINNPRDVIVGKLTY